MYCSKNLYSIGIVLTILYYLRVESAVGFFPEIKGNSKECQRRLGMRAKYLKPYQENSMFYTLYR